MTNVIVAGVGPGMGCSISRHLVESGYKVALISRSDFGRDLAAELNCGYRKCDLNNQAETEKTLKDLTEELGGLDSLIHCAGGFYGKENLLELDYDLFLRTVMNNSGTLFNTVRAAVPLMKTNGGSVVTISAAKHVYYNGNVAYSAGKGAVSYMTRTLAAELGRFNIRVNSVAPGFISKDDCGSEPGETDLLNAERYPSSNIAHMVESLISSMITTGQVIEVDGGVSTQFRVP